MGSRGRPWTPFEDALLLVMYEDPSVSIRDLATKLDRDPSALKTRAIVKWGLKRWSPAPQDYRLRQAVAVLGRERVVAAVAAHDARKAAEGD